MRCARCTGCDGGGGGAWSEAEAARIEKRDHSEAVGRLEEVALIPMQRTRVCVRVRVCVRCLPYRAGEHTRHAMS